MADQKTETLIAIIESQCSAINQALHLEQERNRELTNILLRQNGLLAEEQKVIVANQKAIPGHRPWNKVRQDLEKMHYWKKVVEQEEKEENAG